MSDAITTIQIQTETRELLKKLGHKGKSYDGLLRRLIRRKKEKRTQAFFEINENEFNAILKEIDGHWKS